MVVAESVAEAVAAEATAQIAQLERTAETQRARTAAHRAKLKALRQELERTDKASKKAVEVRLGPLRVAAATARIDRDRARAEVAAMQEALDVAEAERLDAERTAAELSQQVRSVKRTAAQLRRSIAAGPSESIPREPADVARWLDRASATLTPYRDADADETGSHRVSGPGRSLVPAGIAPDSPDAVDALSGVDGVTVLIDGHNLLGVLDASTMATGRARRALVSSLGKLTRHLGDSVIEVVFDSDLEGGRATTVSETGIVVRFAQGDRIADDLIVERAGKLREAAAVVSDDREVRDRCSRYEATVLWSRALADWL